MSEFYSSDVRDRIYADFQRIREEKALKYARLAQSPSLDEQFYAADWINARLDEIEDGAAGTTERKRLDRPSLSRPTPIRKFDDDTLELVIDFINLHWDGDYNEVVGRYLEISSDAGNAAVSLSAPDLAKSAKDSSGGRKPSVTRWRPPYNPVTALKTYIDRVDGFLGAAPFSPWLLSGHIAFAAVYVFLAMALTWAIGGVADLGANSPLLPSADGRISLPDPDFDGAGLVSKRFSILALIVVIVIMGVVGVLTAWIDRGSAKGPQTSIWTWMAGAAVLNGSALWASGIDWLFAVAYAAYISVSLYVAYRCTWRQAVGSAFPVGLLGAGLVTIAVTLVHPSAIGPGGILPAVSILVILIGGISGARSGGMLITGFVVGATLIFSLLHLVYFDGWFRLDPWDPGTTTMFLLLPVVNGFWDWMSLSITRQLARNAVRRAQVTTSLRSTAILLRTALLDTSLALTMIIGLFFSIEGALWAYNVGLHGGESTTSLAIYFEAFQQQFFSSRSLFVIVLIATVLLPTVLHAHIALFAALFGEAPRQTVTDSPLRAVAYLGGISGVVLLLLFLVRVVIDALTHLGPGAGV